MTDIISYSGWIGHNNIGDEALYLANRKLFSEFELVNEEYYNDSDVTLFGGGTVFPHPKYTEHDTKKLVVAIGVGVKDPLFRNQPFAPVDIGYWLGRSGLDFALENKYISHGLRQFERMFDSVTFHRKYVNEDDFRLLEDTDCIGVRGPKSKEILARYGIECQIVGDTALVLEPTNYYSQSTKRVAVTLKATGRDLKWEESEEYVDIIKSFCQSHSDEYEFVFIPFRPVDIPLHIELAKSVKGSQFKDCCSYVDVQAVVDELARCDLVIGERLHASILAACSYTPFISVGYQPKNSDFAESVNMKDYNTRVDHLNSEWLENRADEIVASDDITAKLESEVSSKREKIYSFADKITDSIRDHT